MRVATLVGAAVVLCSPLAVAQDGTSVEIGTYLGITASLPDGGDLDFVAAVPGGGSLGVASTLYATVLSTSNLMFEPQFFFAWSSPGEDVWLQPVMQLGYLFTPEAKGSLYLAAHGGGYFSDDWDSGVIGGSIGFRSRLAEGAALRVEGRFRRWLCEGCDWQDFSLLLGLGAILR